MEKENLVRKSTSWAQSSPAVLAALKLSSQTEKDKNIGISSYPNKNKNKEYYKKSTKWTSPQTASTTTTAAIDYSSSSSSNEKSTSSAVGASSSSTTQSKLLKSKTKIPHGPMQMKTMVWPTAQRKSTHRNSMSSDQGDETPNASSNFGSKKYKRDDAHTDYSNIHSTLKQEQTNYQQEKKRNLHIQKEELIDSQKRWLKDNGVDIDRQVSVNSKSKKSITSILQKYSPDDFLKQDVKEEKVFVPSAILSSEQQYVRDLIVRKKKNVFFTGNAGTGKSFLLKEIIRELRFKHSYSDVAVTASTGIAATSIGGKTLHSFAGIGLGNREMTVLQKMIFNRPEVLSRWKKTRVLIIDEISMIDGEFFDTLDSLGRFTKNNDLPFGGIQLVLCGDFLQLPPVKATKICFESNTWERCIDYKVRLEHVFRQKDPHFVQMLNEIRLARLSHPTIMNLYSLSRELKFDDGIEPTRLYSLRREVDEYNAKKLAELPGDTRYFKAIDNTNQSNLIKKIQDGCMALDMLELKIGAQVMLIKNLDRGLANGSLGKILEFEKGSGYPVVDFVNGDKIVVDPVEYQIELDENKKLTRKQIPLTLSYAMSIHKSQGQTLERVRVDLNGAFEYGQAYVALSRATSLQGLQVLNFHPSKVKLHPKVTDFENSICAQRRKQKQHQLDLEYEREEGELGNLEVDNNSSISQSGKDGSRFGNASNVPKGSKAFNTSFYLNSQGQLNTKFLTTRSMF